MRCSKCGADNRETARFCDSCGAALRDVASATAADAGVPASIAGERRHLTVLFCDLVNSTAIAAQLDPEEWREIVADYHRSAAQAIERFGGHVAQYQGDGVMAYFGWPEAHDNDAERAARAGLAIVAAMSKLNQPSSRPELSARIGIDSGAVVVGASTGKNADVFGDTPNIAARVQGAAEPGTVVITDATHRLVSGLFVVGQLAAHALKGIERPVQLYRVIQPSGVRGRLEAAAATRGLTPFVGREDEIRLLTSRWERVLKGEGQVALIIGEAGIGKSRLLQRFHEQIGGTPHTWIEAHAGALFQNTPFYPVTELLQQFLGGNGGKPAEEQVAQLELAGLKPAETIPLIAPLLNLPLSNKYPPSSLSPEQQRRRLLATLVEWMSRAARVHPMVIATEDLHWADASTLELIQLLVEQGATTRLLLLYTARPEFQAPWPPRPHHTQVSLNRLSSGNVRTMVGQLTAHKALSDETIAAVVERTGGVPLFVEELTRTVLQSGDARLTAHDIPATLHDSLMARLDRLGPAKEVIQVGAVIGTEFPYELLHAVLPMAQADLQRSLRSLTDIELLYVRGIAREATYQFKHVLIRDVAYEALLKSRREELHRTVARTIDEKFPVLKDTHPELLAHHCDCANEKEKAIRYFRLAGRQAVRRSANQEAIALFNSALRILEMLPESPERLRQELRAQLDLSTPLAAIKGYTAQEVERACDRARELCQRLGEIPELFSALGGLCSVYFNRDDLLTAHELAEQMMRLARTSQSRIQLVWAHYALACAEQGLGDFAPARQNFQRAVDLYDRGHPGSYGFVQDPGATGMSFLANTLFSLGYADQALMMSTEAITLAQELSQPYTLALVLGHAGLVRDARGEFGAGEGLIAQMITIAKEQGFIMLEALGNCWIGSALIERARVEEGLARIQFGLTAYAVADPKMEAKFERFRLAQAHRKTGRPDEGLAELRKIRMLAARRGRHALDSYLLELKGELLLIGDASKQTDAERCFRAAVRAAQHQDAKALELSATTHLARVLGQTGRRDEARAMLAKIYNWFTEGFDTADLKNAKALLDELNQ
jgi:class 3 adenylate cyclase/tetratricopeptide (TPR) repeat protein